MSLVIYVVISLFMPAGISVVRYFASSLFVPLFVIYVFRSRVTSFVVSSRSCVCSSVLYLVRYGFLSFVIPFGRSFFRYLCRSLFLSFVSSFVRSLFL